MKKIIVILPLILLSGCSLWNNFTTYFNLYYNTSNDFQEAEFLIYEQKRDLFSTEELAVPGSASQLLTKVIENASKILQFHESTAYVDDALLMLGKSFYYQKNYLKAIRKFQELIANQQNSDLILEDSLWIGKSQMMVKDYAAALKTLEAVRESAIERGEDKIFEEAYLEEIKYKVVQEDYSGAIALINDFLLVSENNTLNAKVSYELGKLYKQTNNLSSAITAYQNVYQYSPDFDVQYNTELNLAIAYRENEETGKAYDVLQDMKQEDKFIESLSEIELQTGVTLASMKRIDEAITILAKVDTAYPGTRSSGLAKYELAKIFETGSLNYDSASNYYYKAQTSPNLPPEIVLDAADKATKFKKYQYISSLVLDNKKQLKYALDSSAFIQDSIAFYADTLKKDERSIVDPGEITEGMDERGNTRQDLTGSLGSKENEVKKPPVRPKISADSIKILIVKSEFDLGNLFFTELYRPDSAFYYYSDILENYPNTTYTARTLYSIGSYYLTKNDSLKADSIFNIIYENYKGENIVNAAASKLKKPLIDLEYDPAKTLYIEAESDMKNERLDSSVTKFLSIYQNYPKSPLAPKALFASGWILENRLKLLDSAAAVYDSILLRFPSSVFAVEVRPKVAFYKEEQERKKLELEEEKLRKEQLPVDTSNVINNDLKEDNVVRDGDLIIPGRPVTAEDSLKLQHGMTVDSLRRLDKRNSENIDFEQTDTVRTTTPPPKDR